MAQIKCPECGKELSNKERTCPNCGHPVLPHGKSKRPLTRNELILVIVFTAGCALIAFGILYAIYSNNSVSPTETSKTQKIATKEESDENSKTEDNGSTLSAEKNLFSVEVTIPASLIKEESGSTELTEEAKGNGVKDVTKNADGSITMKMTKDAHKKMLDSLKASIDKSISETLADKEKCPSFDSITYNDDVTVFDIKVDSASFNGIEGIQALAYYFMGNIYQALNAVPESELKTVVNFIDKDSGEIIESGDSSKMAESSDATE